MERDLLQPGAAPIGGSPRVRQNFLMQTPASLPAFTLAKIQPPRQRIELVERPELERALDTALHNHRLTLLVAPAGYGKTAALTRQLRSLPAGCALAWVSADEDDQLQRFLGCLTTALEPHDLPWRVAPEALATLAQAGIRDVAYEIVNALASAEVQRGLIVIDDAHRIADPQVFEVLQVMLDRLPERWGMAIASRVEPPLSLARWRARGELAEFRQHDLRFNEEEVAALMASSGDAMSTVSSRELLERTGGWAAGLRLSLSARAGGASRGAGKSTQRHLRLPRQRSARRHALRAALVPVALLGAARADGRTLRAREPHCAERTAARRSGATRPFRHHARCRRADVAPARSVSRFPRRPAAARPPRRTAAPAAARRRR